MAIPANPANNTQILQDLYYNVIPRIEAKIDKISASGTTPTQALKDAFKAIGNG